MKRYPAVPPIADAPDDLLESGHLWIQELIDGEQLRFRLDPAGTIRFGGRERVYDVDSVPVRYRHAVRHVRERLEREALREAVPAVDDVVFFGVATHRRTIEYDWDRLPSFLGFDVWSTSRDEFLPPDAVEKIYRRLGLSPVDAVAKEVRAVDFDPDSYEIPDSNWYDGPAAGVIVRNKRGDLASLRHPRFDGDGTGSEPAGIDPTPAKPAPSVDRNGSDEASAADLVDRYATDALFRRLSTALENRDAAVTFDALYDRAFDRIVREHHERLLEDDAVDLRAFRSELAARTRAFLEGRE